MKILTGSSLKFSFVNFTERYKKGCFLCPRDVVLSRPEIHFLGCVKHVNVRFSRSESSQLQRIHPVFSALSSSEAHLEDGEMQIPDENQSKTVRVKFQLQKECLFGQHFFIVGDNPIFGLWDPLKAIPLNWSDEHVWSVQLDVPIGKLIKYKFILKGDEETIFWQPGEDRVLQTWETTKTITVIEDWDDCEIQNIIEEEPLTEPSSEEYAVDSDLLMVAEHLTQSSGNLKDDASYSISSENLSSENPIESEVEDFTTLQSNGRSINGENLLVPDVNTNSVYEEVFPVLVPGMIPVPTLQTGDLSLHVVEENAEADVSLGSDKAEVAELNMKTEDATETSDPEQTTELILNENREVHEDQRLETRELAVDDVLEGDLQWGRRTIQKFLMNFGLL